jgi:ABC-type Fe3+/spermidine/putrescine transport system ATPase subunit
MSGVRFEVRALSKSYGATRALRDVSFAVTAGEHLAVLGPSGSGKSTALRLLAGLETPDSGLVLLNDVPVSEPGRILQAPHRRGISLVFQDLALWPNLSAHANVMMGLSGLALSRPEARTRTQEALRLCGIEELADRKPAAMSGGQQQRVALARAVAVRPAFLLMDEPYAGLDLVLKARLLPEVGKLAALQDMTVILVTHDPLEAMALCRSAVVLDQGSIVEAGPLTDLLRAPRSDLLRVFHDEFSRHEPGKAVYRRTACAAALRKGKAPGEEALAYYKLGIALRAQGKLSEAADAYCQAIKLIPEFSDTPPYAETV